MGCYGSKIKREAAGSEQFFVLLRTVQDSQTVHHSNSGGYRSPGRVVSYPLTLEPDFEVRLLWCWRQVAVRNEVIEVIVRNSTLPEHIVCFWGEEVHFDVVL